MDSKFHDRSPDDGHPARHSEELSPWERAAAYCLNEMSPEERAAFEQQLQTDASLRDEVQAWRGTMEAVREWIAAPAPGVERVDELPLPVLGRKGDSARPLFRTNPWTRAARRLAWAALFLMSFVLGLVAQKQASLLDRLTGAHAVMESPALSTTPPRGEKEAPAPAQETPALAALPKSCQVREENGRVVIETQLKASGAHAVWIVDGSFHPAAPALAQ